MSSKLKKIKAGTTLIHENSNSRKMFILKSGKVRVFKSHIGQKVTIATLGPGEVFGELSFFDAEPRSASVETVTDCEAIVIEGEKALEEVGKLPKWVNGVFKSVFARFREVDGQLMVLQSMNEFQKKSMSYNSISRMIYFELGRYNRLVEVIAKYLEAKSEAKEIEYSEFYKNFDELLGKKYLGVKTYLESIQEQEIISYQIVEKKKLVKLHTENFHDFNKYIKMEVEEQRFLMLSFSGLSLLRVIVGFIGDKEYQDQDVISLGHDFTKAHKLNYFDKAIKELKEAQLVSEKTDKITFRPLEVLKHFRFQSIIRNFDRSSI